MLGLNSDDEVSSSDESVEETFEERKDRVRREKLNVLRNMNTEDRKKALEKSIANTAELDPDDELKR